MMVTRWTVGGLKLVVGLVQQLNGTIDLDRSAGTTFNIVLEEK
jgi:two-component sensor histidine kinase